MYDVIIIGGGIVGTATARALSRYCLKILLIERGADICVGATKANSGIIHAGYDCQPGTLKAELNVKGSNMYPRLAQELDIPYRNNGSMVISTEDDGPKKLQALYEKGLKNGVTGMALLTTQEVLAMEPNLTHHVKGALRAKTASVISPYEAGIAFAENAAENGVEFLLETEVTGIEADSNGGYQVATAMKPGRYTAVHGFYSQIKPNIPIKAKVIINAAGIESATICNYVNPSKESITPQRGQYYLLDNTQRDLVKHTIFQLPTNLGKGVLVVPTVDYNILLGPTAEPPEGPTATETTAEGLNEALYKAGLLLKSAPIYDRITAYAGIRAKHSGKDFIIEEAAPGFISAIGIDSPGLSAAPAIAERIAALATSRLQPKLNPAFEPRRIGIKRFKELSLAEQTAIIKENPAYGRVVCRCETITEGEITEAINRPLGARNLDAIKRRTRAQMGRCQGGFCKIRLIEILGKELGIPETAVSMDGTGSEICFLKA
ncbi:MAG: NAD(P)/FAD-dependent oxidoreductase [Defluviitaleaceae bacterium]|nr:NAD(P)/FAD-dependent oxidoreductase [Defluviitaleaceae bacterium]